MKTKREKLQFWQQRLSAAQLAYDGEAAAFDHREELFRGARAVSPCAEGDKKRSAYHVRNIVAELIESQVDANIPLPKVTPRRKEDEELARIIEDMIRDELDRLPFETFNDMMERTVPIQGGSYFLLEWDHTLGGHGSNGELAVSVLHPKQVVPQEGVCTAIEDMDYIILKIPETKETILRRYGVDVRAESEAEPEVKAVNGEEAQGMVTQYIAYFRNEKGGIGVFSWVNDKVLLDLEDYQARRSRRCKTCGAPMSMFEDEDFRIEGQDFDWQVKEEEKRCPRCSGTFADAEEEFEEIWLDTVSSHGVTIPGAQLRTIDSGLKDDNGEPIFKKAIVPTKIPYYKPDIYPVILQKSVSVFGQLLGDSDVDKIEDQHNTGNRLSAKILDKLLKAGSFATLPADATIRTDSEDMKYIRLENAADKSMIDVFDMQGDIAQDMAMYAAVYEEARNIIGITDSFQGRRDSTAQSGRAKEFSAAQAAGRLESKRVMKHAAYAKLFEAMFKFKLAYADEPRTVSGRSPQGERNYDVFDRYDFLLQDENGEWYWNDRFIFSCDTSASLANNREAMWQETRLNLREGAFGDPKDIDTLILFWGKMAELHYPCAEETKRYLVEKKNNSGEMGSASEFGRV